MKIEYELISSTSSVSRYSNSLDYFYKIALDIQVESELLVNTKETLDNLLKPLIEEQILAMPHDRKKYPYNIDFMTSYNKKEKYFCPLLMIYYPGRTNLFKANFASLSFEFDENPIVLIKEYDAKLGPVDQIAYEEQMESRIRNAENEKKEAAERAARPHIPDINNMASIYEVEQKAKERSKSSNSEQEKCNEEEDEFDNVTF